MTGNSKLQTIQALRGIAAALIVVLHAFHEAGLGKPAFPLRIGVDIFFVISGFIMVYTSRAWFGRKGAWKTFMARRLLRIVPVYWFYTSLLVIVALVMPSALETVRLEPLHLLLSYLFIPHINPTGGLHPFLDLGWTLNYEMYFYVVFAALLFLPVQKMLPALTVFFGLAVAAGAFISPEYPALYFWTRPIVLEFVGGAWIGYALLGGIRFPAWTILWIPLYAIALAGIPYFQLWIQPFMLQVFAIVLVMLAILPEKMEHASVPGWLYRAGNASYTLYLSHPFTLAVIALLGLKFMSPWPVFVLSVPAALIAGYILYLLVEKPLISSIKTLLLRHEETV